ncbi:hypothetical protein [Nonomuraea lactucae]|uniref:hypothetical protein n=1 Tax=Nonomuraea lactucae TaxID=2249762 RepID=UPI000DE4C415|nr:hypothetical protein [Nonomuraea lactucae]
MSATWPASPPLDTQTSRHRRDGAILTQAWTILDALLALPAEMMARGDTLEELSGADAGLELLYLAHRCRRLLADNRQPARHCAGVYCDCGFAELYELDDDGQPAGAKCRACGNTYDLEQYADLTRARTEPVKTYRRHTLQPAGAHDLVTRRS